MIRATLLLLCTLLPACSLFTDDATPAVQASQAREGIFLRQSQAFETVIKAAKGIDEPQRAAMLAGIAKDRADYSTLATSMHEWLSELGSVDWAATARRLYEEWRATK